MSYFLVGSTNATTFLSLWRLNDDNEMVFIRTYEEVGCAANASWILQSAQNIICTNESRSLVSTFSWSLENIALISSVSAEGADTTHLAHLPSTNLLIASNYSSGSVTIMHINNDGFVSIPHTIMSFNEGPDDAPSHAHQCVLHTLRPGDPTSTVAYICDLGKDVVYTYTIEYIPMATVGDQPTDSSSSVPDLPVLQQLGEWRGRPGSGPRHLVLVRGCGRGCGTRNSTIIITPTATTSSSSSSSSSGAQARWACVLNELDCTVSVAALDHATGCLLLPPPPPPPSPHPDVSAKTDEKENESGRRGVCCVYSTLPGGFKNGDRGASDGPAEQVGGGGGGGGGCDESWRDMFAAEILLSEDERFLYVSNRDCRVGGSEAAPDRSSISVFRLEIEEKDGEGEEEGAHSLPQLHLHLMQTVSSRGRHPRHMCLTRGGRCLLVANRDGHTFAAFPLDPTTGLLSDGAGAVTVTQIDPDLQCRDPGFLLEMRL
jgi:6-phosphogluconolactonase (cycloisomerase 2 family)